MIVPNYIPEPLEVPGNVTDQAYPVRVRFIRVVTLGFVLSVLLIAAGTRLPLPNLGWWVPATALLASLIVLEVWRIATRGKKIEGIVSAISLPVPMLFVAWLLTEAAMYGWPTWQGLVGPACLGIYTLLSGRDYSFVGNYLLSLIFSTVAIAATATTLDLPLTHTLVAFGTNIALITYTLYDLASLMSRRRVGEEVAAVTDIYRDVLNFFGYFLRVVRHWRKHRILSLPNPMELPWKGRT